MGQGNFAGKWRKPENEIYFPESLVCYGKKCPILRGLAQSTVVGTQAGGKLTSSLWRKAARDCQFVRITSTD